MKDYTLDYSVIIASHEKVLKKNCHILLINLVRNIENVTKNTDMLTFVCVLLNYFCYIRSGNRIKGSQMTPFLSQQPCHIFLPFL